MSNTNSGTADAVSSLNQNKPQPGMKLRFEVDQAECFRRGIDCPKSIVTIEVKPSDLTQDQRNLIADRMDGIDIVQTRAGETGNIEKRIGWTEKTGEIKHLILAKAPTFEGLMDAIKEDQRDVESLIKSLGFKKNK